MSLPATLPQTEAAVCLVFDVFGFFFNVYTVPFSSPESKGTKGTCPLAEYQRTLVALEPSDVGF